MAILLNIDPRLLERQFGDAAVKKVAEAKVRQLRRASYQHFRDDTGQLRRTIRLEGNNIAAIGDRERDYWQNIYRFRRGDGTRWLREVLQENNPQAIRRARRVSR